MEVRIDGLMQPSLRENAAIIERLARATKMRFRR